MITISTKEESCHDDFADLNAINGIKMKQLKKTKSKKCMSLYIV